MCSCHAGTGPIGWQGPGVEDRAFDCGISRNPGEPQPGDVRVRRSWRGGWETDGRWLGRGCVGWFRMHLEDQASKGPHDRRKPATSTRCPGQWTPGVAGVAENMGSCRVAAGTYRAWLVPVFPLLFHYAVMYCALAAARTPLRSWMRCLTLRFRNGRRMPLPLASGRRGPGPGCVSAPCVRDRRGPARPNSGPVGEGVSPGWGVVGLGGSEYCGGQARGAGLTR
jgi:hypothetical protein